MPTYDYICDDCEYNFEEFQPITANPLTKCPKCQGSVRRLISSGNGFLFKGSGFYITDNRSDSYKKGKQKEESIPATKDSKKTSAKPAKKAASQSLA